MNKVSIIVPVYNVSKYLEKCLDSLVNQTLKDIEIIIVNDGSTDNSQKIIDKYQKKYPQIIKNFIKENGGLGSARNYGISKASGEYIGFVDSDDFVDNEMFEKMYLKAVEDKSDVVVCGFKNVDENYKIISEEPVRFIKENETLSAFLSHISVTCKIYKKSIVDNVYFKTKVWYEDLYFNCVTLFNSKKISFINENLYYYLHRNGSIMNNKKALKNLDLLQAFDDILDYMNQNNLTAKYFDYIEYLAIYNIYICGITRLINMEKSKETIAIIKKFNDYMYTNFPKFKHNRLIRYLPKNKKIIYSLIKIKQYWMVKTIFKIKEKIK